MPRILFSSILFLVLLAGCSEAAFMQKIASPEEQAVAKMHIGQLRQHQFDAIIANSDAALVGPTLPSLLKQMADLFPAGEPSSVTLVGAHRHTSGDTSTLNLTYEYAVADKWLLTNVALKTQGNRSMIVGFSVVPQPASLKDQHAFSLQGKDALRYLVLVLVVAMPLLTIYALVRCAKTRFNGRKWPWVLFILLGIGMFSVNWSTGQWSINPTAIQLLSGAVSATEYGPWTLTVSLPLGAIMFLLMRPGLAAGAPHQQT